ncbi:MULTISPECIES: DUF885 family protein [Asticcacaulis]|uniref:DUF885 domain-containing protein n=1 Tax=Asticcacaulis TaxID=76890 RepID=UPI001AEB69BC|nr:MULTISPECIES: DUF885 family protein [Asticcacaulis]MBP2158747.1 uncharacterized protein (DUF885 family) [Asticcacaulis solisilvae]MDR6799793.1 uncharacterized protein (DUF885 family) [Asticcacaulis sp. BE141]
MSIRWIRAAGLTAVILACSGPALAQSQAGTADAAFRTLYETEWTWRQSLDPGGEDDNTVPDRLADVSQAAHDARLKRWQAVMIQLDAIDPKTLSPAEQINYTVYRNQISTLIADETFRSHEMNWGFWNRLGWASQKSLRTEEDYRNRIAWLNDVPRFFDQNLANMAAGLKRGFTASRVSIAGRDSSITIPYEGKATEETTFYAPFKTMPASIPADRQAELRRLAKEAIETRVIPAHKRVLAFVRTEYMPKARATIAAESLPDGKAYYRALIREYVTLDLTPDQIHQIGLDEVAKIEAEMHLVMKQVGFTGTLQQFNDKLRTDPQFYVDTPQKFLDRGAWISKEFDGKASDWFGRLPRQRFAVIPTPEAIAPYNTGGNGGPGVLILNTYNLKARPLYTLPALVLHEGAPGHAFQMPFALENKALPEFRQSTYISAYGEGWALYTERLGVEMGMYHTPYEHFGMLTYQMWRACRLVVDTGMHAKGWSREKALGYLRDHTALSEHEVTTETDRYINSPGQALSYYLGEMAIWKARHRAEAALGERFDIRNFHDAVLDLGSVPLSVVELRTDQFIADGGRSPYAGE